MLRVLQVSLSSTRSETICTCQNTGDTSTMTVGTTFYVPPNKIDFKTLDNAVEPMGRSPVIGMMIATVCVYVILIIWAWREDVKDQYKVSSTFLHESSLILN